MPLFRRKPITDGTIVCPYCFEKAFRNDEVLFKDSSSNTIYTPAEDGGKFTYIEFIDQKGRTNRVVDGYIPKGFSEASRLTERLCPHCKESIPKNLGLSESKVLAVVGSTQIGKTVYIFSLLDELNKNLTNKFHDMNFSFEDPDMLNYFQNKIYEIYSGQLQPTPPGQIIKPVIVNIKNNATGQLIVISFYDFAGESTAEQIQQISKRQIENASAMLILFDLTQSQTMFKSVIDNQIYCQERQKEKLVAKLGASSETLEKILKFNLLDVSNSDFLNKRVEEIQKELNNAKYEVETSDSDFERGRALDKVKKLNDELNNVISELNKVNAENNKSMSEISEVLQRSITNSEIDLIRKIKSISDKIHRLSEDKKYYGMHYIENDDAYKPHDTPSNWVNTVFTHGIQAAVARGANNDTPIAVVGTKSDEVYEAITRGFHKINESNKVLYDSITGQLSEIPNQRPNVFNLSEMQRISAFVENQLLKDDASFKSSLDTLFADKAYFAVSALGTRYIEEEKKDSNGRITISKKPEGDINHWRVEEPLLWLLYRLGMINGEY